MPGPSWPRRPPWSGPRGSHAGFAGARPRGRRPTPSMASVSGRWPPSLRARGSICPNSRTRRLAPRRARSRWPLDRPCSPRLRALRRQIALRAELQARVERLLDHPTVQPALQERYVTVRHGRYVLPVRAEASRAVRGIVHDRSQSGATLFVEPEAAWRPTTTSSACARGGDEVLRVLAALTDAVRAALPELDDLVAGARRPRPGLRPRRARRAHGGGRARGDRRRDVDLRAARHPLLRPGWGARPGTGDHPDRHRDRRRSGPCSSSRGPNAGGKTVALRPWAARAHGPGRAATCPRAGRRGCPLTQCFAIDRRRAERGGEPLDVLRFVKQLREVLSRGRAASLVLLDELGAGTDPDDGAALAQAVLEELADRGALVVASTHLEPLKGFASTHPRARNASVEFDAERLAPTFRLVYDPGPELCARHRRPARPAGRAHRARARRTAPPSRPPLQELIARSTRAIGGTPSARRRAAGARRRARGALARAPRPRPRRARPTRAGARRARARRRRSGWSPTSARQSTRSGIASSAASGPGRGRGGLPAAARAEAAHQPGPEAGR